ncbi:phosphatase PAP2 family protein [Rhizobium oryzicola]|uniref:Phosphatase PAP2 family protein n=1 Tax=Rhizobium oryzicola TaxID=1232668 RepID=A0ABT8SRX2_9HYPH|nr:phosphatase PAP2 family protein [Rhizobium oryzicola]MDO1580628.1 phosphatase PAP2 family protein [Rhizobium oryzicola]
MQFRRLAQPVLDRVSRMEAATLFTLAFLAGGLFLFVKLVGEIREGDTHALDDDILLSLRHVDDLSLPIGPAWLAHALNDITSLGGVTVLSIITLLSCLYLLLARRRDVAIFMLISVAGGYAVSALLKLGIARPRPDIVPHLVDVHDLSFPSGHAMLSAVTYLTIGALLARAQPTRATRLFMIGAAIFLTLIVGISRVFLGVHYPTDVLGGWCAGALWAMLCWFVARKTLQRPASEETER